MSMVTTFPSVKEEFASIKSLLKVKFRIYKNGFWAYMFIMLGVLLVNLFPLVVSLVRADGDPGVRDYTVADMSITLFAGLVIGLIINMFLYRHTNDKQSVFPQSNTSRFAATQIVNYAVVIVVALMLLVIYSVNYGVILWLAQSYNSIRLALNFDIGFMLAGCLTFLLYAFLVAAVIELIGVILRKWTYIAAVIFIAFIVLGIVYMQPVFEYIPEIFAFLTREPSLGLFTLKALGLWFGILALSFVINKFTIYHKSGDFNIKNRTVVIAIAIAVLLAIGIPTLVFGVFRTDSTAVSYPVAVPEEGSFDDEYFELLFAGMPEIRIDVSHLPRGSSVYLQTENIILPKIWNEDEFNVYFSSRTAGMMRFTAVIYDMSVLEDIQGDTIVIRSTRPVYIANGIDLADFANLRITASLEGYILNIAFEFTPVQVVIMPMWGIARQFEHWADKGLYTESGLGYWTGGNSQSEILITVE